MSGQQLTRSIPELHLAAMRGDLERVKFLVDNEHQNPLQKNKYGNTALHAAAQGGSLDVLKYFIDDRNYNPALQKILGQNDHKCMVTAVSRFIEQVGSMIKGIPQHNYNS